MNETHQERLARLRRDYTHAGLGKEEAAATPYEQFTAWMNDAVEAEILDANCMTLSTVSAEGQPSSRIVLLKDFSPEGFIFYTNYQSRKGRELAGNNKACLQFYWAALERQIHIEGEVSQVDRATSEAYFAQRPRDAQLGAWASAQSEPVSGRNELDQRYQRYEQEFDGREIPCPPHWGGYILAPHAISFWQGRASRMHDRLLYERGASGDWFINRISP